MELDNVIVTKLFNVMTTSLEGGVVQPIKNRYAYGLTFCSTKNSLIAYEHKGKTYYSDYDHAVLLPMGQTYLLRVLNSGLFPLINFYTLESLNNNDFAAFELASPKYFINIYEQIRSLCCHNHPSCNAKAIGLLYEIFSELMISSGKKDESFLTVAMNYMEQNYADPDLTIENIAEHVHLSPGYFRTMFKRRYGEPPKGFILDARMAKAKELMLSGVRPPVSEVAQKCGFTNIYHFSRTFKEYFGCSPTEYSRKLSEIL